MNWKIIESAKVVIVDKDKRICLKLCVTWSRLWFLSWVNNERFTDNRDIICDEFKWEFWINIDKDSLILLEQEEPLIIWNWVIIESNLYVLEVSTKVMDILAQNMSYLIFNEQELEKLNILWFSMEREQFLSKIRKAIEIDSTIIK